jgi:hypothetical protein
MTASIPSSIPVELVAGDTWSWTRDLGDFTADAWTATTYFENMDSVFQVTATASGLTHSFTIAAATTATYKPGRYGWRLRVTDGSTSTTVESGLVEVLVDPAKAGHHDTRTWARKTLEAIECFLLGNASTAQAAMSIQGRSISRWSLSELMKWRDQLRAEVRAEEAGSGAGSGRDIKVRFSRR